MALNIELDVQQCLPVAYLDERFIGEQHGLDCSLLKLERPLSRHTRLRQTLRDQQRFGFISEATSVLTNVRLVLMARPAAPGTLRWGTPTPIHSLEVPLHGVTGERFEQPLLGACRLEATVTTFADQRALPPTFRLSIEFARGGFGAFAPLFVATLTRVRQVRSNLLLVRHRLVHTPTDEREQSAPSSDDLSWTTRSVAVLDPSDPSELLVLEPVPNQTPTYVHPAWAPAASISTYLRSADDSVDAQSQA
ncbi:hypothetical protein CCYA_CCYA16G4185 [Cyanidiococcus yangmingshanensis]|nr:hypothetical protein CCYA_CCYA16G4185 [Cyanidiococcus yangmingshanensis]